jgi:hypothetical protein
MTDPSIGCITLSTNSQLSPDSRTIDWFCVAVGLSKGKNFDGVSSRGDLQYDEGSVGMRKSGSDVMRGASTSRGGSGGKNVVT